MTGKYVDLSQYCVHVSTNLLKTYFRELPDALLTDAHFDAFIAIDGMLCMCIVLGIMHICVPAH